MNWRNGKTTNATKAESLSCKIQAQKFFAYLGKN